MSELLDNFLKVLRERSATGDPGLTDAVSVDVESTQTLSPENSDDSKADLKAILSDGIMSRAVDDAARLMRSRGIGYYTISSAGHEMNSLVAATTRITDPALLHYRSGGFYVTRARLAGWSHDDIAREMIASLAADRSESASGGRHKVFGSLALSLLPQTSTIASHLPKAVGLALSLTQSPGRDGFSPPQDSIVVVSFGDASSNHATALAAFNAAQWSRRLGRHVPILFVCEDNGIGISVKTPTDWVADRFSNQPALRYFQAGNDPGTMLATVGEAVDSARRGRPTFLHLNTVRLGGHAGSDVEAGYRTPAEIAHDARLDPLATLASWAVQNELLDVDHIETLVDQTRQLVDGYVERASDAVHISTRAEAMLPLLLNDPPRVEEKDSKAAPGYSAPNTGPFLASASIREKIFDGTLPETVERPAGRTMAAHISSGLADLMAARPEVIVFGEDVGKKGGVYHATARLQARFGPQRVFDSLLDETSILGMAQGAALAGLLPIPEIQYLAYIHNALDQLRSEAASTRFFSAGQFSNPMVIRVAGWAYQKGFGGHFHNDNSISALLDIPSLIVATPSRGDDAVRILRGLVSLADRGAVCIMIEPIALYHERDRFEEGDGGWLSTYPVDKPIGLGRVGIWDVRSDPGQLPRAVVLTYGNGVRMTARAAASIQVPVRVIDLRWLSPLPWVGIVNALGAVNRLKAAAQPDGSSLPILVVDEARASGGLSDRLVAGLAKRGLGIPVVLNSADSYIPIGPAADTVLLSESEIATALTMMTTG